MTKPGYQISFSNADNVSAWGGLALWAQFLKALRFRSQLARWSLPHPQSNRGYDPCLLVEQFVTNVLCGANRFCHMNTLRTDKAIPQICDWSKMPEQKAFSRFFQRFTTSNQSAVLMTEVYSWCADQARVSDCVTLDVDSTAITRFGHQQGAEVGYNPRYHGRKSHHPLLAFLTEPNLIVNFWLRPGNSHTANNIEGFLEQTKSHLGARRIGLLRADSGFLSPKVIDWYEKQQADFIIAAKMTQVIQRRIGQVHDWCDVTDGIAISEASYKASSWDKSYRVIFIRQDKDIREQAIGKSLSLFEDDWDLAYLQYFADGNKRTSRLMQTAVLAHNNLTPVFMRAEEISNYLKAVIRYYKTGDRRSYADLFIRSYRYTIDNLLNRLPEQLEDIAEDEKRLQEARAKRQKR